MDNFFSTRHSVRVFDNRPVPGKVIEEILKAAIHAPTTGNMQLYSVIVTDDVDGKSKLAAQHFNQPAAVNASAIITFCADYNRFEKWCLAREAKPGFNNFQSFVAAMLDATIVAQQFSVIAEMVGIGTCILGTTTYNANEIGELLSLPSRVVPVLSLAIGYMRDDEPDSPTERLPVDAVLHYGKYSDYNDNDIDRLYAEKENLPENVEFVKENGKKSLAQVFTDVRYPKSNNEIFSTKFIEYIIKQGYNL